MTKNTIYNVLIALFLFSGFYNLSACVFNSEGITVGVKETTSSGSTTEILTTNNPTTTILSSSSTINSSSTITSSSTELTTEFTETSNNLSTTNEINSTGLETTTEVNISSSSMTIENTDTSVTDQLMSQCGDCILQEDEECDWCDYISTQSFCAKENISTHEKCSIMINTNVGISREIPLLGMQTENYDQEEADLICSIISNSNYQTSYTWSNNIGYYDYISYFLTSNPNGKGVLLKHATMFYNFQPLYYFDYENLPNPSAQDLTFHAGSCTSKP